jgi:hypothetical protein
LPRCDAAAADDDLPKNKFLNPDPIASRTQGLGWPGLTDPQQARAGDLRMPARIDHDREKQTFGQFLIHTVHIIDDDGMEMID